MEDKTKVRYLVCIVNAINELEIQAEFELRTDAVAYAMENAMFGEQLIFKTEYEEVVGSAMPRMCSY